MEDYEVSEKCLGWIFFRTTKEAMDSRGSGEAVLGVKFFALFVCSMLPLWSQKNYELLVGSLELFRVGYYLLITILKSHAT